MDAQTKGTTRAGARRRRIVACFAGAIVWSGVTLLLDGMIATNLVSQAIAGMTYEAADGTLLRSAVRERRSGRHARREVDLCYEFAVGGQTYYGWRLFHGQSIGRDDGVVYLAGPLLTGQPVRVYYYPQNPAESALRVGIEPLTVWPTLLLMPFNLVMCAVWPALFRYRRGSGGRPSPAAGLVLSTDGTRTVIRLTRARALGSFWVTVAFLSIAGGILVGLSPALCTQFAGVLGAWGLALTAGIVAALRRRHALRAGWFDVEVDYSTRELLLPGTRLCSSRRRIRFDEIESIVVEGKGPLPGGELGSGQLWVVASRAGRGQRPVGDFLPIDDARAIARRLRAELGLPEPTTG